MATMTRKKERRVDNQIVFVERRKGKFLMYSQIMLSIVLISYLLWLLK
jgi:hypothetical protein